MSHHLNQHWLPFSAGIEVPSPQFCEPALGLHWAAWGWQSNLHWVASSKKSWPAKWHRLTPLIRNFHFFHKAQTVTRGVSSNALSGLITEKSNRQHENNQISQNHQARNLKTKFVCIEVLARSRSQCSQKWAWHGPHKGQQRSWLHQIAAEKNSRSGRLHWTNWGNPKSIWNEKN